MTVARILEAFLAVVILACGVLLAGLVASTCSGCATVAAAKPILDTTCAAVRATCRLIDSACSTYEDATAPLTSGGE